MRPDARPDGTPTWRTWDPRLPFQAVPREKAPNALRVFVFGGSATAGLGYSPNVTFARRLEDLRGNGGSGGDSEGVRPSGEASVPHHGTLVPWKQNTSSRRWTCVKGGAK